jgi:hypothetical protein
MDKNAIAIEGNTNGPHSTEKDKEEQKQQRNKNQNF